MTDPRRDETREQAIRATTAMLAMHDPGSKEAADLRYLLAECERLEREAAALTQDRQVVFAHATHVERERDTARAEAKALRGERDALRGMLRRLEFIADDQRNAACRVCVAPDYEHAPDCTLAALLDQPQDEEES